MHGSGPRNPAATLKSGSFLRRLLYAIAGIRTAFGRERSLRTQSGLAGLATIVTIALRPGWLWGAMIALSIGLVLAFELMNAALEYVIDHLHPDVALEIKHAKDAAAGAVLMASFAAAAAGTAMILAQVASTG